MGVGATIKPNLYAPPASPLSTLIPTYSSNPSSNNFSSSDENNKTEAKPKNDLQTGLFKLGLDTLLSGIVMFITYWKGGGLAAITGERSNKINTATRKVLSEKGLHEELKNFNTHLDNMAVMGPVSHEAFHEYWKFFEKHKTELLNHGISTKELEKHQSRNKTFRKLEAGTMIALLSWARAVFFAPNVSWNNLNFFSPQALLALGFPLVANAGYWYVYDKHAPSQAAMLLGINLTTHLDTFLDLAKAFLKGIKRFVSTDNLAKDLTFLVALVGSAYAVRFARNKLEDPILNRVFNTPKFGPKNLKQAIYASGIRAGMKALIDTSAFTGLIGALAILLNYIFQNDKPLTGFNHFNFTQNGGGNNNLMKISSNNGLTTQSLNSLAAAA